MHVVARDPRLFGFTRARWTLEMLDDVLDFLTTTSLSGLHGLLKRLEIVWKRGRDHVHSPDVKYELKRSEMARVIAESVADPDDVVVVYQDEVTIYRQPTTSYAYCPRGHAHQPTTERSHHSNTITRIAAALDHRTGRVVYHRVARMSIDQLVKFYRLICQAYPSARRIYMIQDNWPIHVHVDVLAALEPQETEFLQRCPKNWPVSPSQEAKRRWGDWNLPIQLIPLPTYASWLNPIEKLWRWMKQEIIHHHRLARDLAGFRREIDQFLGSFAEPSPELLRYVGLGLPM
jgi:transposase